MVLLTKIRFATNTECNGINDKVNEKKKKRRLSNQCYDCSEKIWKAVVITLICLMGIVFLDVSIYVEGATSGFPGTLSHPHQSHNKQKNRNISEINNRSSIENKTQNQFDSIASVDFMGDDSAGSTSESSSAYDFEDIDALSPTKNYSFNTEIAQSSSYQPLRTLEKLQAMLDETDYATATSNSNENGSNTFSEKLESSNAKINNAISSNISPYMDEKDNNQEYNNNDFPLRDPEDEKNGIDNSKANDGLDRLWTSKDRSKYRKKQRQHKRKQQNTQYNIVHQQRIQQQPQQTQQAQVMQYGNSDDDTTTDDTDGDGLGYTLPNLPVFFSDGEETESDSGGPVYQQANQHQQQQQPLQSNPLNSYPQQQQQQQQQQQHQQQIITQHGQQPQSRSQPLPYPYPLPSSYNYNFPQPGPYPPMPSQYQMGPNLYNQHPYTAQYAAGWAAASGYQQQHQIQQQQQYQKTHSYPYSSFSNQQGQIARQIVTPYESQFSVRANAHSNFQNKKRNQIKNNSIDFRDQYNNGVPYTDTSSENKNISLVEAGTTITFDSLQKITFMILGVMLVSYCAVSPRTLPIVEYNVRFKENIEIVSLVLIAPILSSIFVFDAKENDLNKFISTFYTSFTVGYVLVFSLEIIATTFLRLLVFCFGEPEIFQLTPKVPSLVLPWVLRENKYRPKRITLFAADFVTSCIASPIIEEYIKLKIVQWSIQLPRNFNWTKRKKDKKGKKKGRVRELISRSLEEEDVTNINPYVTHMLAASLGLKLCDSIRRILMYTKRRDAHKRFYAICRGIFPVHELCGIMTSLEVAKRDVLGVDMPLWRILAPAVVIHGMANFRGMKPIFKWNSSTPWSEMQLNPWNIEDSSTLKQLLSKGFTKLVWLSILIRVLGYCIKNYYLISRKAVKRATTFAGKQAAFSAELAAADALKKSKTKK